MNPYFTDKEAATIAGVTVGRLRQEILAGNLKGTRLGKLWVIMPDDLRTWMYAGPRGGPKKSKHSKPKE